MNQKRNAEIGNQSIISSGVSACGVKGGAAGALDPSLTFKDERFLSARFPRSSAYHPEWIGAAISGGANPLWLTEWLAAKRSATRDITRQDLQRLISPRL